MERLACPTEEISADFGGYPFLNGGQSNKVMTEAFFSIHARRSASLVSPV